MGSCIIKIPCEECISFAICKQRIREELNPSDVTTYSKWIECFRAMEYIDNVKSTLWGEALVSEVNRARKVFGLPKLQDLKRNYVSCVVIDKTAYKNNVINVVSTNDCDYNTAEIDCN